MENRRGCTLDHSDIISRLNKMGLSIENHNTKFVEVDHLTSKIDKIEKKVNDIAHTLVEIAKRDSREKGRMEVLGIIYKLASAVLVGYLIIHLTTSKASSKPLSNEESSTNNLFIREKGVNNDKRD